MSEMTEWHYGDPFFFPITLLSLHLQENNTYSVENARNLFIVVDLHAVVGTNATC